MLEVIMASAIGMAPECPSPVESFSECKNFRENWLFERANGVIQRRGEQLWIRLTDGSVRTITDHKNNDEEAAHTSYTAVGYFPEQGWIALEVQYYEGGNFEYFNLDSGSRYVVNGEFELSPSGGWLATYGNDMEAQYSPSGLWVFRLQGGIPYLSGNFNSGRWGVTEFEWKSDVLGAFRCEYVSDPNTYEKKQGQGLLKLMNGRWTASCDGLMQSQ